MSDVEKLIARLIDEHKITGEEAVTLIKSCNYTTQKTNSDLWRELPNTTKPWTNVTWTNQNSITDDLYRNANSYKEPDRRM